MNFKQHTLSAVFPPMSDEEYAALVADIAANGQRDPVVIFEREVIDGWHRTRACDDLGIEVQIVPLPAGVDPVAYVLSRNLHRRHLSASQRAMAVASCAAWLPQGGQAKPAAAAGSVGKSIAELAQDAGVGHRTMERAARVEKNAAPEVAAAVSAGTLTVERAADIAGLPQDEQVEAIAAPAKAKPTKRRETAAAAGSDEQQATIEAQAAKIAELAASLRETLDDNTAMGAVFDADDKLSVAMAANKQLRAEVATLRERVNGLLGEKNEAIRLVKSWKRKAEAAGVSA